MAYFPKRAYYALFSKTRMLQVRCAHPTGNFAPKRPFGTFRCCGRLIFRKEYTVLFAPKRSTFRFAARTLRVQGSQGNPSVRCGGQLPPSHRPSSLSCAGVAHGLFYEKSILCSFLQNAHASGSLREPYGYRGAKATHRAALLREKRPRSRLLRGRWKREIGIFTASGGCRPVRCGRR